MYYFLYWYHRLIHTDIFLRGYVGVSNNLKRRDWQHRNRNENPHLTSAFAAYDDIVCDVIMGDTEADCYDMENYFRPRENIGWNIAIGGGKPPDFGPIWASMSNEERAEHSAIISAWHASMTDEERAEYCAKMLAAWTDERRAEYGAKMLVYYASMTDEERAEHGVKVSAGWSSMSDERRTEACANMTAAWTDERRAEHGAKVSARWTSMTDEERAEYGAKVSARWASMTDEEHAEWGAEVSARWASMTDEEHAEWGARVSARHASMTDEERAEYGAQRRRSAYKYLLIDNDCKAFHVDNINQFCRDNALSITNMNLVAAGKRNHHKGFRVIRWPKDETFSMSLDLLLERHYPETCEPELAGPLPSPQRLIKKHLIEMLVLVCEGDPKQCSIEAGCGQLLPRSAFHKNGSKKDGLASQCKQCAALRKARPEVRELRSPMEPIVQSRVDLTSALD